MRSALLLVVTLLVTLRTFSQDTTLVRASDPLPAETERTKLKVPAGFDVQLVACEPMINKPINIAFDARGRLWVSSNTEYPFPAAKDRWVDAQGTRVKGSRDAIKVLEDTDGDGDAEQATDFADGLNIPIAVLPYGDGCIAWSIPNIWYFADRDGNGVCDERRILFGPLGYERDTHGNIASLRMGPDGWVYATHGFSNVSHFEVRPENRKGPAPAQKKPSPSAQNTHLGPDQLDWGNSLDLNSGSVFRFKPDGSAVEPWSWGQVNPFGLSWDAWGNLYSADCHSNPVTQLIRGAFYPSFGKPDDGLGFAPVMCGHSHDSTGLCGVVYFDRGIWGPEWDDHMIVGNCMTSRINRDRVTFTGATPKANEVPDFLVSDDPWFRPVDLQLGPDGALYVADFYNRIIGHYEVDLKHPGRDRERGRIWRIVKRGAPRPATDGRWNQTARFWRGEVSRNPDQITAAAWQAAGARLENGGIDPRRKRIEIEILSMRPQKEGVPVLAGMLATLSADDVTLRHTVRVALRECLRLPDALAMLPASTPEAEIAPVMRTLQTPGASKWLLSYLRRNPGDRDNLLKSLTGIARNLPDSSGAELVSFARGHFGGDIDTQVDLLAAVRQGLAQRNASPAAPVREWAHHVADVLAAQLQTGLEPAWSLTTAGKSPWGVESRTCEDGRVITVLSSLPAPRGAEIEKLTGTLTSRTFPCPEKLSFWLCGHRGPPNALAHDRNIVRLIEATTGAEMTRWFPPRHDTAQRIEWSAGTHRNKPVRLELTDGDKGSAYAWLAIGRIEPAVVPLEYGAPDKRWQAFADLTRDMKLAAHTAKLASAFALPGLSDATRSALARALAAFPGEAAVLAGLFKTAPTRLQLVLADAMASSKDGAHQLCSVAPPQVLAAPAIAQKLAALHDKSLSERVQALTKDLPPANEEAAKLIVARVSAFEKSKAAGTATAGQEVFVTHCAVCHKIGAQGNTVGPQLDGCGNRGVERLCEDILDPHRAVDPVFRLHILTMRDGSVQAGLIRREEGASLIIADSTGREISLKKADVAKNEESPLSLMPAAYGQSIPEADFQHLMAWLLTQRAGP